MRLKPGASVEGRSADMWAADLAYQRACDYLGIEACITSGTDGDHGATSYHYNGLATDYRTHPLAMVLSNILTHLVRYTLGAGWDVVLESLGEPNEHIHVERNDGRIRPAHISARVASWPNPEE